MDGIIQIIKSLYNSGELIDWVSETLKHEIKKREGELLGVIRNFSCFIVRKYID